MSWLGPPLVGLVEYLFALDSLPLGLLLAWSASPPCLFTLPFNSYSSVLFCRATSCVAPAAPSTAAPSDCSGSHPSTPIRASISLVADATATAAAAAAAAHDNGSYSPRLGLAAGAAQDLKASLANTINVVATAATVTMPPPSQQQ